MLDPLILRAYIMFKVLTVTPMLVLQVSFLALVAVVMQWCLLLSTARVQCCYYHFLNCIHFVHARMHCVHVPLWIIIVCDYKILCA